MDADTVTKIGGTGVIGSIALKLLWNWLSRERQDFSLYKNELAAHEQTKKELELERKLRKEAEMELHEVRKMHGAQQVEWDRQRDEDRALREDLKNKVFDLTNEVKKLQVVLKSNGIL